MSLGHALGAAWQAWKSRKDIKAAYRVLLEWAADDAAAGIIILGPGGVGKTTLARLLAGDTDYFLDPPGEYEESLSAETTGAPTGYQITALPGQRHRRPATWPDFLERVEDGKYRGVVVVSAYGYHSIGDISFKAHRLYPAKGRGKRQRFLDALTEEGRKDEIAVMQEVCRHIPADKRCWLLNVVTKMDLWARETDKVREHYSTGAYGKAQAEAVEHTSPQLFRQELALASLVLSNYRTGVDELLTKTSAGFDHGAQIESVKDLLATVDSLRRWELGTDG